MGSKGDFEIAWKARFPDDSAPLLECFEGRHRSSTELRDACQSQYASTQHNIEMLQKELHQQEFISTFLWDLLRSETDGPRSPGLDSDIPVPTQHEPAYHGYATVPEGRNVIRQASTASIPQAPDSKEHISSPYNKHRDVTSHHSDAMGDKRFSQGSTKRSSQRDSQKSIFVYPALTKSGSEDVMPIHEKSLDIIMESARKSSSLENLDVKLKQEGSIHRASSDPDTLEDFKSRPVPAPRPSVHGPSFKIKESNEQTRIKSGSSSLKKKPGPPTTPKPPKPIRTTSLDQPEKSTQPPTLKKLVKQSENVHDDVTVEIRSDRATSLVENKRSSPKPVVQKSATLPASSAFEETIYDAPIPVNREVIDEDPSSSDDEEPVYYNILLMKQQTLKNRSIYASADVTRKMKLESEARQLSDRFSRSIDNSAIPSKPTPPKGKQSLWLLLGMVLTNIMNQSNKIDLVCLCTNKQISIFLGFSMWEVASK
ncbi:hypothetical protein CAPTEDRAFT_194023 [Capitella teleta]|uniref:Uncharacterized protein n=1 Tax=Capitella teleta TaxID=283909 RepID=R7UW49_CAPTE|nr:hypothetical protein CAPTEDRAFT_194023 [Capitella teleta]|eukprot:ELU10554.1 hypothetical protein CAPTEDRAFT_194023 [Capitella teleta]